MGGEPPFNARTEVDVMKLVSLGTYNFDKKIWNRISSEAKDLISKLLTYNYIDRYISISFIATYRVSSLEAIQHPWFAKIDREGGARQLNLENSLLSL